MKRLVSCTLMMATTVLCLVVVASASGDDSKCRRCASKYIWFVGTDYYCCADSENPEILDNCIYHGNAGYYVGDRLSPCISVFNEGCAGEPCNPYDTYLHAPSPIIIALDGNRPRLSDPEHGPLFDLGAAGTVVRAGWPTDTNAGWLVLDRNGNGVIDGVREMFSNATRLSSGRFAANGYEALAELDENRDGFISAADPIWNRLSLWFDRNANGRSDPRELMSIARSGVRAIATRADVDVAKDQHGNRVVLRAPVLTAGAELRWSHAMLPALSQVRGLGVPWYGRPCAAE